MANGNGGFTFVWGAQASTGAIVMAGIVGLAGLWILTRRMQVEAASIPPDVQVMSDIYRASAYPAQVEQNKDRISDAIHRIQDRFQTARDNFKKKKDDLRLALQNGTITMAQFRAQWRLAINEFHTAIRLRHKEIMDLLKLPVRNPRIAHGMPTTP